MQSYVHYDKYTANITNYGHVVYSMNYILCGSHPGPCSFSLEISAVKSDDNKLYDILCFQHENECISLKAMSLLVSESESMIPTWFLIFPCVKILFLLVLVTIKSVPLFHGNCIVCYIAALLH